jgi:lipoprotein-releasing system permease protein
MSAVSRLTTGALGARARSIMLIFVLEGAIIGACGALAGVALGLCACLVGDRYGLVRLPSEVYSLSTIPFHPHAGETLLIALSAFVICLLATLYPARPPSSRNTCSWGYCAKTRR